LACAEEDDPKMSTITAPDGTSLHEEVWTPEGAPRGTLALVHGYGEHIGRYDWVARELSRAGWLVHGIDFRGHGRSSGRRGYIERFDDYFGDLGALLERARGGPGPLYLLGHSMGGLVATLFVLRYPDAVAGLVLSSPFFALKLEVPRLKVLAGRWASGIWPTLTMPTGLRGSDVARDPELAALYETDPLNNKNATVRWFTEARAAQEEVLARAGELTLPCLFLQGGADRVADPARTEEIFRRTSARDKTLHLYADHFHEVFNDLPAERARIVADLVAWLNARVSAKAAEAPR
jgi:alpha-beta hydrolase superfamily lysophospholipase